MSRTLAANVALAALLLARLTVLGLTVGVLLVMLIALIYVSLGFGIWWPSLFAIESEMWRTVLAFATFLALIGWLKGYEWEPLTRDVITAVRRRLEPVDEAIERIRRLPQ